jgi:preprotein translocase subunit SecG
MTDEEREVEERFNREKSGNSSSSYNGNDSGNDSGRNSGKGGNSSMEKILLIITIILGIAVIGLGIALAYVSKHKTVQIETVTNQKDALTMQMIELRDQYSELSTTNDTLNKQISVEREKVNQLIKRIKRTDANNAAMMKQYERELGTLRSIMKHYIVQIDSLNTLNTALREDAASSKKVAEEKSKQYDELKTTTDELGKQVSAGAVVRGRGVSLTAINTAGKTTDRSSRVDKLKACVNLVENAIAKKGYRNVYIRVKDPEGILMTEDQQKIFECAGEQMIYSATREVDYEGDEIEICVFFGAGQKFVKGVYTVDIYTNECKLGSADLMLR